MPLKINLFILLCLIFLGQNVVGFLNIDNKYFQTFLIFLAIIPLLYFRKGWLRRKSHVTLLLFVVLFAIYRLFTDRGEGTRASMLALIGAPLLLFALPSPRYYTKDTYREFWKLVLKIVLVGFVCETALSLFERFNGRSVFGWYGDIIFSIDTLGSVGYRSTAMYGHPLGNALIVTTAMSFILISNLKTKIKFALWGMGYLSILCFNTRGSIVGNVLLLMAYLFYFLIINKNVKEKTRRSIVLGSIFVGITMYLSIFQFGWGGRLIEMGLFDDSSAQTRVGAWDIFDHYDISKFLFPQTYKDIELIKFRSLNYAALENPWLGLLLYNGFIFLTILIILYFFFLKDLLKQYGLFEKLYVATAYFLIASTSNSFDTDFFSLYYFLLLCIIFSPKLFVRIVPSKYRI